MGRGGRGQLYARSVPSVPMVRLRMAPITETPPQGWNLEDGEEENKDEKKEGRGEGGGVGAGRVGSQREGGPTHHH